MNTRWLWVAAGVCALLLTGCAEKAPVVEAPKGPPPAEDLAALKTAVVDDFLKAYNAGDAAGIAAAFTAEGAWMPPNRPAVVGREAMAASLKADFEGIPESFASVTLAEAVVDQSISGDWGYMQGTYEWVATPKKGAPLKTVGKWLAVARRQPDGSWKMSHFCWNDDAPMPPPK